MVSSAAAYGAVGTVLVVVTWIVAVGFVVFGGALLGEQSRRAAGQRDGVRVRPDALFDFGDHRSAGVVPEHCGRVRQVRLCGLYALVAASSACTCETTGSLST